MKDQELLHGPFVANLPNAQWLDMSEGSVNTADFTVPVDGLESPSRLAKFVFNYDKARISAPPADMAGWLDWAAAHPGRITHPAAVARNVRRCMLALLLGVSMPSSYRCAALLHQPRNRDDVAVTAIPQTATHWTKG